jgi:hypothetical protein
MFDCASLFQYSGWGEDVFVNFRRFGWRQIYIAGVEYISYPIKAIPGLRLGILEPWMSIVLPIMFMYINNTGGLIYKVYPVVIHFCGSGR